MGPWAILGSYCLKWIFISCLKIYIMSDLKAVSHLWPWQIGNIFLAIKEKNIELHFMNWKWDIAWWSDTKMLHFNFTANGIFSFYCAHWARCRPLLFYCVILHLILLFLQGKTKHLDNWIKLSSKEKDHVLQSGAEITLFSFLCH